MSDSNTVRNTTVVQQSRITQNSSTADALKHRDNILDMTQQAEQAVIDPDEPGAWPTALRAALAARIATHNKLPELADQYRAMIVDKQYAAIADPSNNGDTLDLAHVTTFMDRVSMHTSDISQADIKALQQQAVSDADIVRLTELNAFMGYQVRLIAGLRLLAKGPE